MKTSHRFLFDVSYLLWINPFRPRQVSSSVAWCLVLLSVQLVHGEVPRQLQTSPVQLQLSKGFTTIANNFHNGGNTVAELLPQVLPGTLFEKSDGAGGLTVNAFKDGEWERPQETLSPGEGAWVYSPGSQSFTFSGQVLPRLGPPLVRPGRYFIGGSAPMPTGFEDWTGLSPAIDDVVYLFNGTYPGGPAVPWTIHYFDTSGWNEVPILPPGKGGYVDLAPTGPASDVPVIIDGPHDVIAAPGTSVQFAVQATSVRPLSYQWSFNGAPLPGAQQSTLVLPAVSVSADGFYVVEVRDSLGASIRRAARLTVREVGVAPTIVTPPQPASMSVGGATTFGVQAQGSPPLRYQWFFRGQPLVGAVESTLSLLGLTPSQAGPYSVKVSNSFGETMSAVAELTVISIPPPNSPPQLSPLANHVLHAGMEATFVATATDPDLPAQQLTFALEPGTPASARIDPLTGLFVWNTSQADAGSVHEFTVRVADNGSPPREHTGKFVVAVVPPSLTGATSSSPSQLNISWSSVPGLAYLVQSTPQLSPSVWTDLAGPITAVAQTTTYTASIIGNAVRYFRIIVVPSTDTTTTTTTTSSSMCVIAHKLHGGLGLSATAVVPAAGESTLHDYEFIPLIVRAEDVDQLQQDCTCIERSFSCTESRLFDVSDTVNYAWSVVEGGGSIQPIGPATLYRPVRLNVGDTHKIVLRVEITDSRGNDTKASLTFTLNVRRTDQCEYRQKVEIQTEAPKGQAVVVSGAKCNCVPKDLVWEAVPTELSGEFLQPTLDVCAGQRVVLRARGNDSDTAKLSCGSTSCGSDQDKPLLVDELVYRWSADKGSFPDYPGVPESNGRNTSAIYLAPDEAGEATVTLKIRDLGKQGSDSEVEQKLKLKIHKLELSIGGIAQADKMCKGGVICRNDDDDNSNKKIDREEVGPIPGEDDLVKVTLKADPKQGKVIFEGVGDVFRIKVWKQPTKGPGQELILPAILDAKTLPLDLWIEGIVVSDKPRDLSIALSSMDNGCFDQVRLTVVRNDIDVDSNRDGVVEDDPDDTDEGKWELGAGKRGALVLPNCDKDNTSMKAPDNWVGGDWDLSGTVVAGEKANRKVDEDPDKADLAALWVHKLGPDPLPESLSATLEVRLVAGENAYFAGVSPESRVRIFLPTKVSGTSLEVQAGDKAIIGPDPADGAEPALSAKVQFVRTPGVGQQNISLLKGKGILKCGFEGIECGALVDIVFTLLADGKAICQDTNRIRVAPYVVNNHTQPVNVGVGRKVGFVRNWTGSADLRPKLKTLLGAAEVMEATATDQWQQDGYEIGYAKAPYGALPVTLVSPRAQFYAEELRKFTHKELLRPGVGVCWKIENIAVASVDTFDSFGNLESKPHSAKSGDFFHGQDMFNGIEDFHTAQEVNPDLPVNTEWLVVGHVDEVVSFGSDGKHTVIADPEVCWGLLVWANQLDPAAKMLANMKPHVGSDTTVDAVLTGGAGVPANLRKYNLADGGPDAHVLLPANLPSIRTALGLPAGPVSSPTAAGANAGGAKLTKAGAFVAFFPGTPAKTRNYRISFTSASDYTLEFREAGAAAWTLDRAGAKIDKDEAFPKALCFVLHDRWDVSGGAPKKDDRFEFSADPASEVVEMPVIFRPAAAPGRGDRALNYSNNHVNCVVHETKVLTAIAYGPHVKYDGGAAKNLLGDYAEKAFNLAGYTTVLTADDRAYSNLSGSLHCGSNVERQIPAFKWWEK